MRYLEFVYTRVFERSAKSLLDDDDMRAVAWPKNKKASLTDSDRKKLRELVKKLEE